MHSAARVDVAFTVGLAAAGLVEVLVGDAAGARGVVVVLVGASALLLRSRRPVTCFALAAGAAGAAEVPALDVPLTASLFLGTLVALSSVGQRRPWSVGVALTVVTYAGYGLPSLVGDRPWDAIAFLLGTVTALGVGRLLRREAERSAQLAALAAELAAEREARADEAVREERGRIARELHDAVAHTVSVMTIQVGGVRRRLAHDPARSRETDLLRGVEELGREAVTELHRAVGVLRALAGVDDAGELAPQPGLADLETLAERVRTAGLPVDVQVDGTPRPLPGGLDLAAYRVVQEALTNALKHAGAASVRVAVRFRPADVEIEVVDDGRGADGAEGAAGAGGGAPGHGLAGMRERVAVYGGVIRTGATPAGGYVVRALLPAPLP